jgi:hypothetical protein
MRKLNNEKIYIVDDILYKKNQGSIKTFTKKINRRCRDGKKITLVCIIQSMLQYYIKQMNANLLKPKIIKLTYTMKSTFNINGTTIYSTLIIPLQKK